MEIFVEKLNKAEVVKLGGVSQSVRYKAQIIIVDMTEDEREILGFTDSEAIVPVSGNVGYGNEDEIKAAISNAVHKKKLQYEDKIKVRTTEIMELSDFDSKFSKLEDIQERI